MNKQGFTLIELLAAIVIISLIAGIGAVAYSSVINSASNHSFERYRDSMHAEAINYVSKNYNTMSWNNNTARINLSNLKMESINNPKNQNDLCTGSYVDVTRSRNSSSNVLSITYNVCLICNDFNECKTYEN